MKGNYLLLTIALLVLILFSSCSDEESTNNSDCREFFLSHLNLEVYEDQDLGCRSFYNLVEYNGDQYVYYDNFCADLAFFTFIDCNGDTTCSTQVGSCDTLREGTNLGILGFKN